MRQRDENFLSMARAVQAVLNRHEAVWKSMTRFGTAKELLDEQVVQVDALNAQSNINTKGATQDKLNAEDKATYLAVKLCDRARVYAQDNGDMELWKQLEVSYTSLTTGADSSTLARLEDLHGRLMKIKAELAAYGITDEDLDQLKTDIGAFQNDMSRPRDLTVERKGYHTNIPLLLQDMRQNFRVLDGLINLWDGSELETQYWDARIIIDLGKRKKEESPTEG